jgi:hypothetical protein
MATTLCGCQQAASPVTVTAAHTAPPMVVDNSPASFLPETLAGTFIAITHRGRHFEIAARDIHDPGAWRALLQPSEFKFAQKLLPDDRIALRCESLTAGPPCNGAPLLIRSRPKVTVSRLENFFAVARTVAVDPEWLATGSASPMREYATREPAELAIKLTHPPPTVRAAIASFIHTIGAASDPRGKRRVDFETNASGGA